jgi:hypothetical protein
MIGIKLAGEQHNVGHGSDDGGNLFDFSLIAPFAEIRHAFDDSVHGLSWDNEFDFEREDSKSVCAMRKRSGCKSTSNRKKPNC